LAQGQQVRRDGQRGRSLLSSKGVTLQGIEWNTGGSVKVVRGPVWCLSAAQAQAGGPRRLFMNGTIRITDKPDSDRPCETIKGWHFAST
jgi:hypothetical protein